MLHYPYKENWQLMGKWYFYIMVQVILVSAIMLVKVLNPDNTEPFFTSLFVNIVGYGGGLGYLGFAGNPQSIRFNLWFIMLHWVIFGLFAFSHHMMSKLRKDITILAYVELYLSAIGLLMYEFELISG